MTTAGRSVGVVAMSTVVGFAIALALGMAVRKGLPGGASNGATQKSVESQLISGTSNGDTVAELTLVMVSSGTCSACADKELPRLISGAKKALARRATEREMAFGTIGVGLDQTAVDGWKDLERFGRFDELLIGRGLSSVGGIIFLWRDYPGALGVPQALVLRRRFSTSNGNLVEVGRGRVMARLVGVPEIGRWANRGYPLEGAF